MIGPVPYVPGFLEGVTAGLAGQSMSDAWSSTGMRDDVSAGFGFSNWTSNEPSISGDTSGTISDGTGDDASEAWGTYSETSTVSDRTGGVVDGSYVGTINYSLLEDSSHKANAVEVVSVSVPDAIVAINKALGVAMEYGAISPSLTTRMTTALTAAGLVFDKAKNLVKAWRDADNNILLPKEAIDIIDDILRDENIGGDTGYYRTEAYYVNNFDMPIPVIDGYTGEKGSYIITFTAGPGVALVPVLNGVRGYAETQSYFDVEHTHKQTGDTYTERKTLSFHGTSHAGHDYYYLGSTTTQYPTYPGYYRNTKQNVWDNNGVADIVLFGIESTGGYPPGTARSPSEETYTKDTYPIAGNIATHADGTAPIEVVKVNLPDSPLNTMEDDTGATSPTDPDRIGTLPAPPIPAPIPDTRPSNPDIPISSNPTVVNSELVDAIVNDLATTLDPQPAQSSGFIPVPMLPGILNPDTGDYEFPSIIPGGSGGSAGTGFIHVYNPTPSEFVAFGNWLWVTYADATIDKILNNPFDGVIGAHELYATPNRDGRDNIRSAFLVCPTSADLVTNRYSEIDCGTVVVPEFYGNYLDYSPYSQAYIYLPFIGINEVSIDDIVGHAVNIRYRIDSYSGSCIAMIFVAKGSYQNLCYQFAGSCSVEVPMAGGSQAAIKAGMMQAEAYARAAIQSAQVQKTASIGTGIVSGAGGSSWAGPLAGILGALAGGTSGYIQGSANAETARLNSQASQEAARVANKSSVQHSGQFGASHGAMGQKTPFIIIRNPIQVKVVNYNDDYGFPAHKRVIIGGCTGFLRVREVNVVSAHATNEEKRAIEEALKAGVYVS